MFKPQIFNILFLPLIILIGGITSFEDIKESLIRNKWILSGILYSCLVYCAALILAEKQIFSPLIKDMEKWSINLIISCIVGYFLWYFKMWAAGDAKLFICYAALIPFHQYSRLYFNGYFAAFLLLLAIFLPPTILISIKSILYFLKRFDFTRLKNSFRSKRMDIAKILFGFFVFFLLFRILNAEFQNAFHRFLPDQNLLFIASLLAFKQISKFFRKNVWFMVTVLIGLLCYLAFKPHALELIHIGASSLAIVLFYPVIKKTIDFYTEKIATKHAPFAHWMFLGALIVWIF